MVMHQKPDPMLASFEPGSLVQNLSEFDRRVRIIKTYLQELSMRDHNDLLANTNKYFSPFASQQYSSTPIHADSPCAADATATSSSSTLFLEGEVNDEVFRTPLVSWSSFQAHAHHILNSDQRARFLHHVQLVDDFLDARTLGQLRAVISQARQRVNVGRAFDQQLQTQIDMQRASRQKDRDAVERRINNAKVTAVGGPKITNSKERKRERWQQRNRDKKRQKLQEVVGGGCDSSHAPEVKSAVDPTTPPRTKNFSNSLQSSHASPV
jgi:hypothetical protein